ncbi:UNVERIFIED_ORG: hypothetical protein J2W19_001272 [Shinella zoogloeoides]|nr:hypothetical protein [Shinella zoogloeoides]
MTTKLALSTTPKGIVPAIKSVGLLWPERRSETWNSRLIHTGSLKRRAAG